MKEKKAGKRFEIGVAKPFAGIACVLCLAFAGCKTKEQGGLTFDFRTLSQSKNGVSAVGENLAAASEPRPCYGFVYFGEGGRKYGGDAAAVRRSCRWVREGAERCIRKGEDILAAVGGDCECADAVLAAWQTDIPIHGNCGGSYRLAFNYKCGGRANCIVRFHQDGRILSSNRIDLKSCDSEWVPFVKVLSVPNGVTNVTVHINHSGMGELRYRDFSFVRQECPTPITVTQAAHGQADKSFAVGAGQVGCITYLWRCRPDDLPFDARRITYRLTLPRGFSFVAANWGDASATQVKMAKDGVTTVLLPTKPGMGLSPSYNASNFCRFGVLVRASSDAPEGTGTFEALYDGRSVSNVERTRWFTIPPVRVAAKPKRYANGFFPGSDYGEYADEAASEAFAEMASTAGADWWIPARPCAPRLREIYRKAGIRIITPQQYGLRDGYHVDADVDLSLEAGRPTGDRFVARDENASPAIRGSVCPFAVSEERPYFLTNTVVRLKERLAGFDGLWSNWEPFPYINQGCMCDYCRKKFGEFAAIPADEVTADAWFRETAPGGKWYAKAREFRGVCHGDLVKTVNRHITAMTGGASSYGFIPGIAYCEMSSYWRPNDYPPEVKAIHYAGDLKWINPWGPYVFWDVDSVYSGEEGEAVACYLAAKDVREQVNRDYPEGRRPKLLAFPQGAQCCEWITQPEWLGLSLDSFFFNGWEASVVYFFPKGYDARYWRAFAEATARAARYEDFVLDGQRCDEAVSVRTPGFGKVLKGKANRFLPYENVSLVQHAAYERDGVLIVAALNFADEQAATVEISHPTYGCLTGTVPAARCRVFELRKWKGSTR